MLFDSSFTIKYPQRFTHSAHIHNLIIPIGSHILHASSITNSSSLDKSTESSFSYTSSIMGGLIIRSSL